MAFRGRGRTSSYYTAGSRAVSNPSEEKEYTPAVDKNPHYRTNDIFNRIYRRQIKLEPSKVNKTDCLTTIWLRFSDPVSHISIEDLGKKNEKSRYLLDCGHEWSGKNEFPVGKALPCTKCGGYQSYLAMEHEWQHVIFKSNPLAEKLFLTGWVKELRAQAPHVGEDQLEGFLHLLLNAFDDIRCNSLWEKVYPGSAEKIWERWRRLLNESGEQNRNENFIAFMLSIGLGIPVDPNGPYGAAIDTIRWGMEQVRYKGFGNMLSIAKISLDRCLGALLAMMEPQQARQQPQQSQQSSPQSGGQQQAPSGGSNGHGNGPAALQQDDAASQGSGASEDGSTGQGGAQASGGGSPDGSPQQGEEGGSGGADPASDRGAGRGDGPVEPPPTPSGTAFPASPDQKSDALSSMIRRAEPVDEDEEHHQVDIFAMVDVPKATQALVARALQSQDPAAFDSSMDPDMVAAIDQFHQGMTQISPDSQLVSDAKAKILFIDVQPAGINPASKVVLSPAELGVVERTRSVFFRTMGKQKAHRSAGGTIIDLDAAIQYGINPSSDPEIFEIDQNNRGFAYLILVDMSGSMGGRFKQVQHAAEMLKRALYFPFVEGEFWGFRGGSSIPGRQEEAGETWLYRYDKECVGYEGKATVLLGRSRYDFPVACGGLTPMHSAIRVAGKHLLTNIAPGMAKQLFILTDGSPVGTKTTGRGLPSWILRDYIGKEVRSFRQKGMTVQALVIGSALSDDVCKAMFGNSRFWKKASDNSGPDSIDQTLQQLVLQNFQKYLHSRD